MTGISGITPLSPAISIARNTDQIAYSYYSKASYKIYSASYEDFKSIEVSPDTVNFDAATLPPLKRLSVDIVDKNLTTRKKLSDNPEGSFFSKPYLPKFKLDYIGNTGVGISASRFGTGMAGSVDMLFSDIIGNNQIYAGLALNGEIYDFGGQVAYFNQKRKINWGSSLSHIPWSYGMIALVYDSLLIGDNYQIVENLRFDKLRTFEDQISIFAYLPISQTRRIEGGVSFSHYSYRIDRFNTYYDLYGFKIGMTREKIPAPDGFSIQRIDIAYVEDNSFFGMASPFQGHRMRFQLEKYYGKINLFSGLFDYRKYIYMKPFNLSFRLYHYGRYGKSSEVSLLYPLFIGMPGLVRGYDWNSFYKNQTMDGLTVNHLIGSRMCIGNIELRLPVSGPEKLALIRSGLFFTEIALFLDVGLAWDSQHIPGLKWEAYSYEERAPVFSTGISLRVNLFGSMIIEPFYAFPLQREQFKRDGIFGLNFIPGW